MSEQQRRSANTATRSTLGGGAAVAVAQAVCGILKWRLSTTGMPPELVNQVDVAAVCVVAALLIGLGTWARDKGGILKATVGVLGLVFRPQA